MEGSAADDATGRFGTILELLGAFVDGIQQQFQATLGDLLSSSKRVSWVFLLVSGTIACVVLGSRRWQTGKRDLGGLLRAVVPAEIYLHRSSLQDYLWLFLSPLVHAPLLARLAFLSQMVSVWVYEGCVSALGPSWRLTPNPAVEVLCAFLLLLAIDLGNYASHWMFHRFPSLWEFHKTHHSAEVLNPATADRLHPLERVVIELWVASCSGVVLGLIAFVYWPYFPIARLFGFNVFVLLTNIISGNLRHSHVWLSYGPIFERIFSSPAQHQIHHSRHPDHLGRNLATHFALWDWLFGTLYVTKSTPEVLELGLADGSMGLYRSPWALFAQPFRGNWARLRDRAKSRLER